MEPAYRLNDWRAAQSWLLFRLLQQLAWSCPDVVDRRSRRNHSLSRSVANAMVSPSTTPSDGASRHATSRSSRIRRSVSRYLPPYLRASDRSFYRPRPDHIRLSMLQPSVSPPPKRIPAFAPAHGTRSAANFRVIARANRATSWTPMSGTIRVPPRRDRAARGR
jgi:hypothetical protein